jgi:hypothetical protein
MRGYIKSLILKELMQDKYLVKRIRVPKNPLKQVYPETGRCVGLEMGNFLNNPSLLNSLSCSVITLLMMTQCFSVFQCSAIQCVALQCSAVCYSAWLCYSAVQ